MNNVLVLGAGAWGTAIANLIANNSKKQVYLWSFEKEVAKHISACFINKKYLPAKKISTNILFTFLVCHNTNSMGVPPVGYC